MRYRRTTLIMSACFTLTAIYVLLSNHILWNGKEKSNQHFADEQRNEPNSQRLHVAVVACGQRLQETLVMIKSAIIFNHDKFLLHFIVFTEDFLFESFHEKLSDWRTLLPLELDFELVPLQFPQQSEVNWQNLFKPCASQRLFLPTVLKSMDAVLYVDTDVIFMSPLSDIWNFFNRFNESQIAGLSPEHEVENIGWYNRFARHPYYGKLGLNSGVMLMNLTRMRQFKWESHILPIYKEYKLRITWGDQDLINILFYHHPEKLCVIPCEYNYRPDHCMYTNVCNSSTRGIKVVHGNRGYFHSGKQPIFRILYESVEGYQLGIDTHKHFLNSLEETLKQPLVLESSCGKMSAQFLQVAKQTFY